MTDSAFPAVASITVQVLCAAGTGQPATHSVTVGPGTSRQRAWTAETGHDLGAERVAVALGGERVRCLDIVETELPAIQRYYEALRHDPLVSIKPKRAGRWGLTRTVIGCSCETATWESPEKAVAHFRSLDHWVSAHQASRGPTRNLLRLIQEATGASPWSERWPLEVPSPAVGGYDDLWDLWKSGLHPDLVRAIHTRLGLSEPLDSTAYFQITSRRIDLEWMAQFADSALAVAWVARTYTRYDRSHPTERIEWYRAGVNLHLITDLLGSPYTVDDLRILAAEFSGSLNTAAHVLAEWHAAKCAPPIEDLVRVCRLVDGARPTPATLAVDAVISAAGLDGSTSRTEVALILVAAGTPTTATALIRRGVRTLDEFDADRRDTKVHDR